jgi:hypothetical protein
MTEYVPTGEFVLVGPLYCQSFAGGEGYKWVRDRLAIFRTTWVTYAGKSHVVISQVSTEEPGEWAGYGVYPGEGGDCDPFAQ